MIINLVEGLNLGNGVEIEGITLLTASEAQDLLTDDLKRGVAKNMGWWTRSRGDTPSTVVYVTSDGRVDQKGYPIEKSLMVRPALIIKLDDNLQIGDEIYFGGKRFQIISDNLAFCKGSIGDSEFRLNADWSDKSRNLYRLSDVKKKIDRWLVSAVKDYRKPDASHSLPEKPEIAFVDANLPSYSTATNINKSLLSSPNNWMLMPFEESGEMKFIYYNNGFHDARMHSTADDSIIYKKFNIRPVIYFLPKRAMHVGARFEFGGHVFEVIESTTKDGAAFCVTSIGEHAYKDKVAQNADMSLDYWNSDVQSFVNQWFREARRDEDYKIDAGE